VGPGDRVGRYQLAQELGQGGMATVFRARDEHLRREVAVKVLHAHLARRPEIVARFQREGRVLAGLDHPNILRIFDVGMPVELSDGAYEPPYLVMELVPGGTLRAFLLAHGAPLGEVVASIGVVLCDALATAHAAGVIHRDLKPANVIVAAGGRLVLSDFGLAHMVEGDSVVTHTGAVLGTPAFMAPEQALGRDLDARSDLYSLGATLYWLATGALPFDGPAVKVLSEIARGELVPPLRRNPAMGGALAAVIERLMAREPERRYAHTAAARAALAEVTATAGLGDPASELAAYFAGPSAYNAERGPAIARATIGSAHAAAERGELPRAFGLADRVLALDPGHPDALALVARLGAAGRTAVRARWLSAGAAAVAVGIALGWWWPRGDHTRGAAGTATPSAAAAPAGTAALSAAAAAAGTAALSAAAAPAAATTPAAAAGPSPAAVDAGRLEARVHAAGAAARDAGDATPSEAAPRPPVEPERGTAARTRPAHPAAPPAIATPAVAAPDAAAAGPTPPDAATATATARATLAVVMNAWCDVSIDGRPEGRWSRDARYELVPGVHELRCSQGPGKPTYAASVELAADEHRLVTGALLMPVTVHVAVAADAVLVRGLRLTPGQHATIEPGRHRVQLERGGRIAVTAWVRFADDCTLRERPRLACD
jgi:serine/threonine-protein kinase